MITTLLYIGRLLTPAAMIVFLSLEISGSFETADTVIRFFVVIGAVCTAVGVESVGIGAGHALERFTRREELGRAVVVFGILLGYTAVNMLILWGNEAIRLVPIVAAIMYILAALIEGEQETAVSEQAQQAEQQAFELEQQALDRKAERERLDKQIELDATAQLQVQIAQVQAEANIKQTEAKAKASIANARAREAKVRFAQEQMELAQAQQTKAQEQAEAKERLHVCEDCGREFDTVQALNAHGRFCKGVAALNGQGGK